MKLLITGAFGNVGKAIIEEADARNHDIVVFEIDNKKNRRTARKYRSKINKVIYGDIRNFNELKKAVQNCEAIIHLAAIIPPPLWRPVHRFFPRPQNFRNPESDRHQEAAGGRSDFPYPVAPVWR